MLKKIICLLLSLAITIIYLPVVQGQEIIVINTGEEFKKIADAPDKIYRLDSNITLENYTPFEFSGKLYSDKIATITVNIDVAGDNVGLFSKLTNEGKIENIRLKGLVKGANNVGGFVGSIEKLSDTKTAYLKNLINEASVTATGNGAGGIVGSNMENKITINGLVNYGSISSNQASGGIVGINAVNLSNCANYGIIFAKSSLGGGICGQHLGNKISSSFNSGSVNGSLYSGGIAGTAQNWVLIENSYNSGEVKGTVAAGIIPKRDGSTKPSLTNCYNVGNIITTGTNAWAFTSTSNVVITNGYFLENGELKGDPSNVAQKLNSEAMKTAALGNQFEIPSSSEYVYPNIKTNSNPKKQISDIEIVTHPQGDTYEEESIDGTLIIETQASIPIDLTYVWKKAVSSTPSDTDVAVGTDVVRPDGRRLEMSPKTPKEEDYFLNVLQVSDSNPVIIRDEVLVPVSVIIEALGGVATYNSIAKEAVISVDEIKEEKKDIVFYPAHDIPKCLTVYSATQSGDDGAGDTIENIFDGSMQSRWAVAYEEGEKAFGIFDLGEVKQLDYIGIAYFNGGKRVYEFSIDVSEDGKNYKRVYDHKKSLAGTTQIVPYDLKGEKARYVRYVGYGNNETKWNSIAEMIFVEK